MTYRPFEADLSGRVALVTGANSGMGKETARDLARMGAAVILGCRSTGRGETARREIMEQASRMLTWALADRLRGIPVTVNALNPGFVVTDLTRRVGGLLKAVVVLTSFRAQTPLDGADTAIWLAASPEVDGITGKFWNKRREVRCRFRDTAAVRQLCTLVEQQTAATVPIVP
jgi:NAD(P)-dependent dehydrogenase (short-subunit alcohol dehydrogenase family)